MNLFLFKLDIQLLSLRTKFPVTYRLLPLQKLKDPLDLSQVLEFMSTERCAKLMAVSMANKLDEVWISTQPALLMVYFKQYLPDLFRWYVLLNVISLISCIFDDRAVVNGVSKLIKKSLWFWVYHGLRLLEKANCFVIGVVLVLVSQYSIENRFLRLGGPSYVSKHSCIGPIV